MTITDPPARRPATPAPRPVDVDQRFDAHQLAALRAALVVHGRKTDARDDWIDELLIVAGELAANVVRHGGGVGRLRLWRDEHVYYCEVTDYGPGFADPHPANALPDPGRSEGGRGLWLCRHLATELIIQNLADRSGATVTAVIPVPNQRVHTSE